MAERRMFAKSIIDSDLFLDMPLSTQALYFHLSMRADDEGFVNNPRKIQKMIGASDDDIKILISKRYILAFDSGIIVIKHWKIHNYIQTDRFKATAYTEEKSQIMLDENKMYTVCIQNGYKMDTQVSIGKVSIGKDSIKRESIERKGGQEEDKYPPEIEIAEEEVRSGQCPSPLSKSETIRNTQSFKKPTLEEIKSYCEERKNKVNAEKFMDFYESKGWFVGKNKMKDWKACVRTWEGREKQEQQNNPQLVRKEADNELLELYKRKAKEKEERFKQWI